jgi:hypothetical protein
MSDESKPRCGARRTNGQRCMQKVDRPGDRCRDHLGKGELVLGGDWRTSKLGEAVSTLPGTTPQEIANKASKDWLVELRKSGDWRSVAMWLWEHRRWLNDGMATFAANMSEEMCPDPTPRQLALLISLRGGVECLMQWDAMPVPKSEPQLTDDDERPRYLN